MTITTRKCPVIFLARESDPRLLPMKRLWKSPSSFTSWTDTCFEVQIEPLVLWLVGFISTRLLCSRRLTLVCAHSGVLPNSLTIVTAGAACCWFLRSRNRRKGFVNLFTWFQQFVHLKWQRNGNFKLKTSSSTKFNIDNMTSSCKCTGCSRQNETSIIVYVIPGNKWWRLHIPLAFLVDTCL